MGLILIVGTILCSGFILGECAHRVGLPKVTGYIVAGILLNPGVSRFIPQDFNEHTDIITNIALAFITFSVGGTLQAAKIRELGQSILAITFFEAEFAFLMVAGAFVVLGRFLLHAPEASLLGFYLPFGLLAGCLASPTDPSATLAVIHEYKAKGPVTDTVLGVAAFDDILGIINYSIAVVIAIVLTTRAEFTVQKLVVTPLIIIGGAVLLGILFGFIFNAITQFLKKETEGSLIVLIFGLLSLCFGAATLLNVDELLATVTMGVVVVNFNRTREKIFQMLERYTEELIFVLFFTISGMHLNFGVMASHWGVIVLFALFRLLGKHLGVVMGGSLSRCSPAVRKYTTGGLVSQGGIVIGLALLMRQQASFAAFSDILINTIIGATVLHQLIGPLCAKVALVKAGEISSPRHA